MSRADAPARLSGECRKGQIPRPLGRFKLDAPLLAAGYLTGNLYPKNQARSRVVCYDGITVRLLCLMGTCLKLCGLPRSFCAGRHDGKFVAGREIFHTRSVEGVSMNIMEKLELLSGALEYMERHLREDLHTEDVAAACFCSKSTLEKLFRYVNHLSVREYLIRRRMSLAAKELWGNPQTGIMDVALEYGYNSHEAFTRAFKQIWNCKPSEFRERHRYSELFPRLDVSLEKGEYLMSNRKRVDISELYDLFRSRKECYFVCCDIVHMIQINDISRKAGDLAILETFRRMEEYAGPEDMIFRIGGDEFVILTASEERDYAERMAKQISSRNGQGFAYEGQEIPLSLHVGVFLYQGKTLKYNELFAEIHKAIQESKK